MMTFYRFYATVHCRPANAKPADPHLLRGTTLPTLTFPSAELGLGFDRTFEETAELLGRLERMFIEPDGSFVWVSATDELRWQIDGVLFDRDGCVLYVDLKGSCPSVRLDQLLTVLDWPQSAVMFQLVHEAVFLDEPTFRRYAAGDDGEG